MIDLSRYICFYLSSPQLPPPLLRTGTHALLLSSLTQLVKVRRLALLAGWLASCSSRFSTPVASALNHDGLLQPFVDYPKAGNTAVVYVLP